MKRLLTAVLALSLLFATAITAGAQTASFSDITDPAVAHDVAVLQLLGAVSGDGGGSFMPNGTLTRAAFCKMAVIVMGKGDQEPLYKTRTIFPDVRSGHWARGYINYAVSSDKKFIVGNSDGTFRPEDPVTCAQAVAMAMRILGYTDADAGMLWPAGYLMLAADKGVTAGINVTAPNAPMSRAQAARLFCNLLDADTKTGEKFVSTLGTAASNVVVTQLDVTADDGTGGAIRTSEGVLKVKNGVMPESILGLRGTLVRDSLGRLLTFIPDKTRQVTITASAADARWIKDLSGVTYTIKSTVTAYTPTEKKTFGAAYDDIANGMTVTLYYGPGGEIDGVFINSAKYVDAVVIGLSGSGSLGQLTGGDTGYKIIKNGMPVTASDLQTYDVATYDSVGKTLYVSDFRLTGIYESAWPSIGSPSKITVLGHEFPVLPSAIESLASCTLGKSITLFLTSDHQVAGASGSNQVFSTAIGIVEPGITPTSASVKLLNGLVVSGNPSIYSSVYEPGTSNPKPIPDTTAAEQLVGELVIVSSPEPGRLSLTKVSGGNALGALDLTTATLGGRALSPIVRIFERVGAGPVAQIKLSDLIQPRIDSKKILYAGTDYSGRINMLVLNDVTGDRYDYGILRQVALESEDMEPGKTISNRAVSVINSKNVNGTAAVFAGNIPFQGEAPGGVAFSADGKSAEAIVQLTEVRNVKRSAFYVRNDVTYVSVNGAEFPVASSVQCYNRQGKTWFAGLDDARAFSETLSVYYDRPASEGGKIRVVVAE